MTALGFFPKAMTNRPRNKACVCLGAALTGRFLQETKTMLNLRSANPADLTFVMATERLPDYVPILGQWEKAKHHTEMESPANAYFIGESMGKPEGFAIIQHLDDPMGNVLLRRVAMTNPGRGLGRELVRRVAAAVFARPEPHRLWLHVLSHHFP